MEGNGVWIFPSYINHSCLASASCGFLGDIMIVRACRDLKLGEQVTHNYVGGDLISSVEDRQERLKNVWGFICKCPLCTIELEESTATRSKRKALAEKSMDLKEFAEQSQENKEHAVSLLERLAKAIEASYTKPGFIHPRLEIFAPLWLMAYLSTNSERPEERIHLMRRLLDALGFRIEYSNSQRKVVVLRYGLMVRYVVDILNQIACESVKLGNIEMAKAYKELARNAYEIIVGERDSFDEIFKPLYRGVNFHSG
jgi:SET domain